MFKLGPYTITLTPRGWLAVGAGLLAALVLLVLAWALGLVAIILTFALTLLNALWLLVLWVAGQLGLLTAIGWVIAQITAIWSLVFGWFASTWLGNLLLPIYGYIAPLVGKVSPLITMTKWGKTLWAKAQDYWQQSRKQGQKALTQATGKPHSSASKGSGSPKSSGPNKGTSAGKSKVSSAK
ncbi:MAG: hypothetical protein WAX89_02595 [Alphaproteobacteria bacterium]